MPSVARTAQSGTDRELLTADQACELLQISRATLWRMEQMGAIARVAGLGHLVRYNKAEILAGEDQGSHDAGPEEAAESNHLSVDGGTAGEQEVS